MLIDYAKLEQYILDVEDILKELDVEEKELVMRKINQRIAARLRKQKIEDDLTNNKMYNFAKKLMGKDMGED